MLSLFAEMMARIISVSQTLAIILKGAKVDEAPEPLFCTGTSIATAAGIGSSP